MRSVAQLVSDGVGSTSLNILVFGPQVENLVSEERTRNLQLKRIQIREALEQEGHNVKYGEDLYDSTLPPPFNNAVFQEEQMAKEYDLIVTLVESPGSIAEATFISLNQEFSLKSALFMDEEFLDGFPAETCRLAEIQGATFQTYKYPVDLVECNLLGFIREKVRNVQMANFLN